MPGCKRNVFELQLALFLEKKLAPVGDDQSHVTGARLIHTRVVNFLSSDMPWLVVNQTRL